MSAERYGIVRFPGDVTEGEAQPGRILGHDEAFMPWEVLDLELEVCPDCDGEGTYETEDDAGRVVGEAPCPSCRGRRKRTTIHLQHAGREVLLREGLRLEKERTRAQVRVERLLRSGLMRTPERHAARNRVLAYAAGIRADRERRAAR